MKWGEKMEHKNTKTQEFLTEDEIIQIAKKMYEKQTKLTKELEISEKELTKPRLGDYNPKTETIRLFPKEFLYLFQEDESFHGNIKEQTQFISCITAHEMGHAMYEHTKENWEEVEFINEQLKEMPKSSINYLLLLNEKYKYQIENEKTAYECGLLFVDEDTKEMFYKENYYNMEAWAEMYEWQIEEIIEKEHEGVVPMIFEDIKLTPEEMKLIYDDKYPNAEPFFMHTKELANAHYLDLAWKEEKGEKTNIAIYKEKEYSFKDLGTLERYPEIKHTVNRSEKLYEIKHSKENMRTYAKKTSKDKEVLGF